MLGGGHAAEVGGAREHVSRCWNRKESFSLHSRSLLPLFPCFLLAACCLLPDCPLLSAACLLPAACRLLFAAGCVLRVAAACCCLRPAAHCPLPAACCRPALLAACCVCCPALPAAGCLSAACCPAPPAALRRQLPAAAAAAAAAAATAAACIFGWTAWTNTVKAEIPARTLVRWPGLDAQSVPKRHDIRIRHLLARPQTLQNHFHWLGPPVPPPDPFGGPSRGLCPPIGGAAGPRRSRQAIPKGPQAAPGPPRRPPAAPPFGGP